MKHLLATLVPVSAVMLSACGEPCGSQAVAARTVTNGCSTLAASVPVTIRMQLCPKCTETVPTCVGEVVNGSEIHLDSTVQQCQSQAACDISGCTVSPVACQLDQPLKAGQTYTVFYSGLSVDGDPSSAPVLKTNMTVTAEGGGPISCSL